jgi:ABC-type sugar transport system ATPase subunit
VAGVRLEGLTKRFEQGPRAGPSAAAAVDAVSLEIADGEFAVLVGPSGCGKTTLLRMVAGLETPTAGRIWIGADDVTGLPPRDRDVAMVFQNYALYPHLAVRDNIGFGLRMHRMAPADIARKVRATAEMLEIGELLDRRPAQLSGGQRQRVALARAIVREPRVFLFDEPLSNLDAQVRAQTRVELVALHRRLGATMIYVTHDQVEAMTMAQRVAVLRDGRLEQVAPPLDLYRRPDTLFVAGFIGSPKINRFEGRVEPVSGAAGGIFVGTVSSPVRAPVLARATLAVRPEHLHLSLPGASAAQADVEHVERLGAESHVLLRFADGAGATARVSGSAEWDVGAKVSVAVAPGSALVFDPATGRRASD